MDIQTVATAITESSIGTAIRTSDSLFPLIEFLHVLAITSVVGSIAVVDLRMLGIAWMRRPFSKISSEFLPYTWTAFAFALLTGGLLFASHATEYLQNPFFLAKMSLLALAALNMLVFHFVIARRAGIWDMAPRTPLAVKLCGAISLGAWISIITCGRFIGFWLDHIRFG